MALLMGLGLLASVADAQAHPATPAASVSASSRPATPSCGGGIGIHACPGDGAGVIVDGSSDGSNAQGDGRGSDRPTERTRVCSTDDPACAGAIIGCGIAQVAEKRTGVAALRERRRSDGSWELVGNECIVEAAPAQVTSQMVREQAERLVPTARVGLAPQGTSLVNIETVMWADAPGARTLPVVTILGRSVSIRLSLDHVSWDFGDGESEGDGPAGRAYDKVGDPCRSRQCRQYFGHTYRHTGTVRVGATASWTASFTVDGGAAVDIPGTVAGPPSEARLVIKQARAVLVPNPGEH